MWEKDLIFTILEKISILIAIWVAIAGIDSWRKESRGKREIELAEDALASFYEVRDAIAHIRHPAGYSSETENIERGDRETDTEYEARRIASVVFVRYNQYSDLFNKLHAMRYRFMALIGKNKAKPFDDLRKIENDIFRSARMLARLWVRDHFRTQEQFEIHSNDIKRHEAVFWGTGGEDDPIEPRIENVILDMERICGDVISGEGGLHALLNRPLFKRNK